MGTITASSSDLKCSNDHPGIIRVSILWGLDCQPWRSRPELRAAAIGVDVLYNGQIRLAAGMRLSALMEITDDQRRDYFSRMYRYVQSVAFIPGTVHFHWGMPNGETFVDSRVASEEKVVDWLERTYQVLSEYFNAQVRANTMWVSLRI